jgi:ribosomal protein S18 acetylase RimI-like enzyme
VTLRRAGPEDEATLAELWAEFEAEVPEPDGFAATSWEAERSQLAAALSDGSVQIAYDDEGATGFAWAAAPSEGRSQLEFVYVRPRARRQGVAKALLSACLGELGGHGVRLISLEVLEANAPARAVWRSLGFTEVSHVMVAPLDALAARVAQASERRSRAAVHVRTADRTSVERAVHQFVPRFPAPVVDDEPNGWMRISDPTLDSDIQAQARLAAELSERLGAVALALALEEGAVVRYRLYERGRMVDEYLSVPTYYGALSTVDELALSANPTLVARLTGASFAQVRQVARTASSSSELPAPEELYTQIAGLLGVEP